MWKMDSGESKTELRPLVSDLAANLLNIYLGRQSRELLLDGGCRNPAGVCRLMCQYQETWEPELTDKPLRGLAVASHFHCGYSKTDDLPLYDDTADLKRKSVAILLLALLQGFFSYWASKWGLVLEQNMEMPRLL